MSAEAAIVTDNKPETKVGISDVLEKHLDSLIVNEPKEEEQGAVADETPEQKKTEVKKEETPEFWKSRYENLEKAFSRQGTETGNLRKEMNELKKALDGKKEEKKEKKGTPLDQFVTDPDGFIEEKLLERKLKEREELDKQQQLASQNIEAVYRSVPEVEQLTDIVLELAKKDGIENPSKEMWYDTIRTDPALAVMYAKRAKEYKELTEVANRGKKTLNTIARGSKNAPLVTGSTGSSSTKDDIGVEDVDGLSTAEIKRRIAQLRNNRR